MRRSRYLLKTIKEIPKEAVVASHILLTRAGMIRQHASGIYSFLPLGLRSIQKIERIIREELDRAGCQEVLMPVVQPSELWVESGRWNLYGDLLMRMKDRKGNMCCLGPTHEEVITDIVRREVQSYKDLPLNLYQIQTKFRDELRPRFGLMRGREFIMKDAYSFDVNDEGANDAYWNMHEAYKRIFERCGLGFRPVEADSGEIGGNFSHEFHVLAQSGEDEILSCSECEYAANVERAEVLSDPPYQPEVSIDEPKLVETPGVKSIEALGEFLKVSPETCIKTLAYVADDEVVGACIMGHHSLNEIALKNATGATNLELLTDDVTFEKYGLVPGYLGPVNWPSSLKLFVDQEVMAMAQAVTGANAVDQHMTGVVPAMHIDQADVRTLRAAQDGDLCPRCKKGRLKSYRGIEVGHIFKLGTKYSKAMKATFLDEQGRDTPIIMGCYGIGVGRTMAAAIEQNHDDNGISWPASIAPFHVMMLNLDPGDDAVNNACNSLYDALWKKRIEVLMDDSKQRPGFKFKDADLIGLPVQITLGARALREEKVEVKIRKTGEKLSMGLDEVVSWVEQTLTDMGWEA